MPRRVDANEHLIDDLLRRVPLQFKIVAGNSVPSVGDREVVFWKDTSNAANPVGKIVIRIGHELFIFSSSREVISAGAGQVLVDDDDQQAGYLDDKLLVDAPLTKEVNNHPGNFDGGDTLTLGLDQAGIDHGSIGGLSDDDHAQYALLAGRPGGQTLYGSPDASENLVLQSSSNATPGTLWLEPNSAGRLAVGVNEYDPYVSSNVYSGRFFISGEDREGPNNPNALLHLAQFVRNGETYPYALSVVQRLFQGCSGSALFTNAQFQDSVSAPLARAIYAYISVGGSNSPSVTEAIGVTSRIEVSNSGNYTTGHGFHAVAAVYGSARIQTYNAFEAAVPDITSAGIDDIRGLHIGDLGPSARDSCDAILVEPQDDGFDGLSGNIRMAGGDWNTGHFQLGQAHIWATSGDLRFSRTEPGGATDYDFAVLASTIDVKTRRVVNLTDPTDAQDAATKAYVDGAVVTDHGSLGGLSDDDHPQYALLAGRSGGQTLHGGSADSEDLVLRSTAGTTLGHVHIADRGAEPVTVGEKDTESNAGKLYVEARQSDGWRFGLKVQLEGDAASATFPDAFKALVTLAGSSAQDGRGHTGVAGFCRLANDFSEPGSEGRGGVLAFITSSTAGSATLGVAIGARCGVQSGSSVTINTANVIEARLNVNDTSTVSEANLVRAFTPTVDTGATLTTLRGLYVEDLGSAASSLDAILVDSQSAASATKGNLRLAGGDWNTGHLQLNTGHVWATGGVLRFSSSAPASATDYDLAIGSTIDVASRRIVNVSDPTDAQDAATKAYVDAHAGGGGLSDAYSSITDGSNTATASGGDTFKLRSANDRLSITVTNDDATHGDNALFTLDESKIVHQNLSGAGSHDHSDIDSHIDASSGVHGISGSVVGTTDTQTLANKTLTSPTINSPSISDASLSGSSSVSGTLNVSAAATFTGAVDAGGAPSLEIPNGAGGATLSNAGEVTVNTSARTLKFHDGSSARVLNPLRRFSVTIESPSDSENITLTHVNEGWVLRKVIVVLRGSSSPSVTFNLKHAASRANTSPSSVWAADKTASSETTGDSWTTFDSANIGSGRYLWLTTSATAGDVAEMNITVYYDEA